MVGREQIVTFLAEEFRKLFVRDVSVDFRSMPCEGHTVILEERMRATLANGRQYENDYCFFFELSDDGLIAKVREYMDTQRGHECIWVKKPSSITDGFVSACPPLGLTVQADPYRVFPARALPDHLARWFPIRCHSQQR
jgi:hypothetical protein